MTKTLIPFFVVTILTALCVFIAGPTVFAGDRDDVLSRVPAEWREDVCRMLDLAADEWNDGELLEALDYYPSGTAKHRAVCFLIAQMDSHLFVDYVNPDDPLNPFSPEDGSGEWHREYIWDYSTMSADLLIENVEWAFLARESFSWCRSLPEDIFFEYVLPYRSTQEPLHSWRPAMFEELTPVVEGLRTTREVAAVINRLNTERFHFDPLYYRHPEDRDIPTAVAACAGRCEDMSNLSNYSLRTLGVPTTSDFTPWWPKGDNNHAWNTVYDNGTWYQFMGCEGGEEQAWDTIKSSIFAKVWRSSFSADPIMGPAPDGTEPPRLMRNSAVDVTTEYTTVSDVETWVDNPARATYLCVFNFGTWRSVAGAWAEDHSVFFPDVGNKDILYCPTRYVESESGWGDHYPVGAPFTLHQDGSINYTDPCPFTEPEGEIVLTGFSNGAALTADTEVTLFRYTGNEEALEEDADPLLELIIWEPLGTVTVEDTEGTPTVIFSDVAVENGLYLLSDSEDPEEFREGSRPFVWSTGEVTYY